MRIAIFSSKPYDRSFLDAANASRGYDLVYFEPRLTEETVSLARGFETVCVFVNDALPAAVLQALHEGGTRLIALRCAGFNNVDVKKARELGMTVVRVPAYSPNAVAEHTVGLILALNRKIHRAYNRVREANFALDGLIGFDMVGRTVGVVGTGQIGRVVCRILLGFGCKVVAFDPQPHPEMSSAGIEYVSLEDLYRRSDIVTLHLPLTPESRHMINSATLAQMKPGVMLINTSRGALVDTTAALKALKSGQIGNLGLDVYEEEAELFFEDRSEQPIPDDVFARLLTFPNVLITGHQAFFTSDALNQIAETTLGNVDGFVHGEAPNQV